MQFESSRFSALGEEAFVPSTRTRQSAAFVLERWTFGASGHFSGGLRAERVQVHSDGDKDDAAPQFGPAQARSFSPRSASLGAVLNLSPHWQLTSNGSYTERAPTSYELYAHGVHAATSAYERGNPLQAKERGRNLDLALGWREGANHVKVGVFDSRFANYIALTATGEPDFVGDAGGSFPVFAFRGVRARLYGLEADAAWRVLEGPRSIDLDFKLDVVHGNNDDTGEPLPRLAPRRATVGLNFGQGAWTVRAEVQHASAQKRVPATDVPTASWTRVNLSASHALAIG
jgi:iron complex outermembrane receptor protein